ncbi:uncharacterized protein LOC119662343 [Teleopsis dalmanni]|uniref:uncharacterized protein LOC119662326 n=1 Tax=Teleopsis dalmanni TaxID=139649 RepID=UPI0018CEA365|nr:uncharacterized protein LOC119662326 [Teleopsis dalmanni]XP_037927871.1 uncharacterized protein LOC119662343 [Teleopsis dalmanni]
MSRLSIMSKRRSSRKLPAKTAMVDSSNVAGLKSSKVIVPGSSNVAKLNSSNINERREKKLDYNMSRSVIVARTRSQRKLSEILAMQDSSNKAAQKDVAILDNSKVAMLDSSNVSKEMKKMKLDYNMSESMIMPRTRSRSKLSQIIAMLDSPNKSEQKDKVMRDSSNKAKQEGISMLDTSKVAMQNSYNVAVLESSKVVVLDSSNIVKLDASDVAKSDSSTVVEKKEMNLDYNMSKSVIVPRTRSQRKLSQIITMSDSSNKVEHEGNVMQDSSKKTAQEDIAMRNNSKKTEPKYLLLLDSSNKIAQEDMAMLDSSNIADQKDIVMLDASDKAEQEDMAMLDSPNEAKQKDVTLDDSSSDSSFEIKTRSKKKYPRNRISGIVEQKKKTMDHVIPNDNNISDSSFAIQTRSKTRCAQNTPAPCIVTNEKKTEDLEKQDNTKEVELKNERKRKKKALNASTDNSYDENSESDEFMKHTLTCEEEGYLIFPDIGSDEVSKYCPENDSDEDSKSKEKDVEQISSDSDSDINSDDSFNWVYSGELPTASYHEPNPILENRFGVLRKAHDLTGNLIGLKDSIKFLNDKTRIVGEDGNPKLRLWAQKWRPQENKECEMEIVNENGEIEENITNEECKRNLLDHIVTQQKTVEDTLNKIESELAALEIKANQDGVPGFDFCSTLQEIQTAMIGLGTLKKIAAVNATEHERSKEEAEKSENDQNTVSSE